MSRTKTRDHRRAILEAARKLFLESGYAPTTMEEIAASLKMSKKTLYAEFSSKPAIREELFVIEGRKTAEYLKTYLPSDLPPLERLTKLAGYYVRRQSQADFPDQNGEPVSIDFSRQLRDEGLDRAFPQLCEDLIIEAQNSGTIHKEDSSLLAAYTIALTKATLQYSKSHTTPATLNRYLEKLLGK